MLSERWRVTDEQIEHLVRQTAKSLSSSGGKEKAISVNSKSSLSWAPPGSGEFISKKGLPPISERHMVDAACLPRICLTHQRPVERRGSGSRPASKESTGSRRSSSSSCSNRNGRIRIQVYVPESGDTFSLLIQPDALIGPSDASENAPMENRFPEMLGSMACTTALDEAPCSFDFQWQQSCPKQAETPRTEASDKDSVRLKHSVTLKDLIEHFTGVELIHQRLHFRGTPVGMPHATLRSYGITDGATMQLHISRRRVDTPAGECTRTRARNQKHSTFSVKNVSQFQGANPGDEFWPMPRWVWQQKPKLFAPLGIGMDGNGGAAPCEKFEATPIFVDRKWG